MKDEYNDLPVSIHVWYGDAVRLLRLIESFDDDNDAPIISSLKVALANAEREYKHYEKVRQQGGVAPPER